MTLTITQRFYVGQARELLAADSENGAQGVADTLPASPPPDAVAAYAYGAMREEVRRLLEVIDELVQS